MTVKEFIQFLLIDEIKSIQQNEGHHYLSFGLISQGIEFLGACIDNHDFNTPKVSKTRFDDEINNLFPSDYHQFVKKKGSEQFDLYGNLRCGLLHIVIPGSDLELIQELEINDYGEHLEVKNIRKRARLILVSQRLMKDFEDACNEVIRRIDKKEIVNQKVYGQVLSTSPDD